MLTRTALISRYVRCSYLSLILTINIHLCINPENIPIVSFNRIGSASVGAEGPNRERALQSREVHGLADSEREDGAPRTDVPEQQGEETRHGSEEGREMRAQKAVKNALEEELIAEMYEMIL